MAGAALRDRQPASTFRRGSADVAGERWKPCLTSPSGETSMHIRVSPCPIAGALDDLSFDAEQAAFSAGPPAGKPKPNLADRHPAWGRDFPRSRKNRSTPYSGTRAERSSSGPAFFIAFFIESKDAARALMSPCFQWFGAVNRLVRPLAVEVPVGLSATRRPSCARSAQNRFARRGRARWVRGQGRRGRRRCPRRARISASRRAIVPRKTRCSGSP